MYPFLHETVSRAEIVASDQRLIGRSHDAIQKSRALLALACPDVFLGRRSLIEQPPIKDLEAA